ncbi:hypothetical protein [Paraburkholderia sp. EG304]|uniref:hypothetical protein n=1 Tax=Paraburkholderia sp. EG304 TaxID=3237015 RepID=UPI003979CF11
MDFRGIALSEDFSAGEAASPSPPKPPRIPPETDGIQVNFCKSPLCQNFGQPASPARPYRRNGRATAPGDYTVTATGKENPALKCEFCSEIAPLRSNLAIAEEVQRITAYLTPDAQEPACVNDACAQFNVPLSSAGSIYVSFGQTAAGTPRYRCKACGKAKPLVRQRRSEKNKDVFLLLMNRVPISRISETTGLAPKAIYDKLAFIHRQCMAFAGNREARLLNPSFVLPKMYVAVDRQHYIVNWTSREDRRTTQLNAIGTSDVKTGFVFGMHLNFDGSMEPEDVEADALKAGDLGLSSPFRKYARVWLSVDYKRSLADSSRRGLAKMMAEASGKVYPNALLKSIDLEYADASAREDIESSEEQSPEVQLPLHGMQVRETYTMYAHFRVMATLLRNAPKVRFFMDQDSGFRVAFMSAFADRIRARTADGFYVKVDKEASAYEKKNAAANANKALLQFMATTGITDEYSAKVEMMKLAIGKAVPVGRWGDRWVRHPLPNASEPSKEVCWLTDMKDYEPNHVARLMLRATLHPIDRFFMQTRRRVSLAERPVISVRRNRNMWHGYGAYNPETLARYLDIYRVYFNYCLVSSRDRKTPAMRLGLAKAPIDPHEILYFC